MNHKALFLPSLAGGGAERVMVNLANGFVARGHEVDLVLARAEGPYLSQLHPAVRVVDLGAPRVLAALPALVRYLRQERPTALLSALDHANVVALLARRLAGTDTRVVVSVHSLPSHAFPSHAFSSQGAQGESAKERWLPYAARLFYPQADAVVAVSRSVAGDVERLIHVPRERIRVIYNPVVTPELFERAQEPVDHPWFAPGAPPVVLGAGRLTRVKNFSLLIEAFAGVRARHANGGARLVILGEGEERGALERLVAALGLEDEVWLPGWVGNPYAFMARAGVFVLSSRWEGLPTVLIEALALGAPVVATDCAGGTREILEGGVHGRLVAVGDAGGLAQAVCAGLAHPKTPRPNEAWKRFEATTAANNYLDLLAKA